MLNVEIICTGGNNESCTLDTGRYKRIGTSGSGLVEVSSVEGPVIPSVNPEPIPIVKYISNTCEIDPDFEGNAYCDAQCPVGTKIVGITECYHTTGEGYGYNHPEFGESYEPFLYPGLIIGGQCAFITFNNYNAPAYGVVSITAACL